MRSHRRLLLLAGVAAFAWLGHGATARCEEPTPEQIADMIDDLTSPQSLARRVARDSLTRLGPAAVTALADAALATDEARSAAALAVLGDMGAAARDAAPRLVEHAIKSDARVLRFAKAVARIDPAAGRPLVEPLLRLAESGAVEVRYDALVALEALGPAASGASERLRRLLPWAPERLRSALVSALVSVDPDAPSVLVDAYLNAPEADARWLLAAVRRCGDGASRAAVAGLTHKDKHRRTRAAELMRDLVPSGEQAVRALVTALGDEAAAVRRAAAQALGAGGAQSEPALPALARGVAEPALRMQLECIAAIGDISLALVAADAGGVPAERSPHDATVRSALAWLVRHQDQDGRWNCDSFDSNCKHEKCTGAGEAPFDQGVTGLALLGFLGAGETHLSGRYKDTVKSGLKFLKETQDQEGCFGPRTSQHFQYNHLCASLAMTEAYGRTRSPVFKDSAQSGVDFTCRGRNPYLGWRYGFRDGDNDTSVTGWSVTVLSAAAGAGLAVDKEAFAGALAWIDKMTEPEFGRVGYQQRGGHPARTTAVQERFPPEKSESLTAVGVLTRMLCRAARQTDGADGAIDPLALKGAELMSAKPPRWDADDGSIDFYYWYYGSLAMHRIGGKHWERWRPAMEKAIAEHQCTDARTDEHGSWDPADPWAAEGGRVYSTALCLRTLQTGVGPAVKRVPMPASVRAVEGVLRDAQESEHAEVRSAAAATLARFRARFQ